MEPIKCLLIILRYTLTRKIGDAEGALRRWKVLAGGNSEPVCRLLWIGRCPDPAIVTDVPPKSDASQGHLSP